MAESSRDLRMLLLAGAAGMFLQGVISFTAQAQDDVSMQDRTAMEDAARGKAGSPFIPLDSWIYPAALRLHDLGYLSTLYVGLRPYTRASLAHALLLSRQSITDEEVNYGHAEESVSLYHSLARELAPELDQLTSSRPVLEQGYVRVRGITGPVLNDSFHLGQTYVNDYGRPFQQGFNAGAGASGYVTYGRANLYVRGEYQHAPGAPGYSPAVAATLAAGDGLNPAVPHFVIPAGPIPQRDQFRLLNALASIHVAGHQIAFGRSDEWLGPAAGGSMAWSNNAEPIYAFHINRVEPLSIPGLSRFTGPFRYEFFVGSLKGHDAPNAPWVHMEKASFKPTKDLEFGFARTALWGGEGHVPVTIGTFFRSFFSPAGVQPDVKGSRRDPGARFSTFDFSYRIPAWGHLFTTYADSFVHDNVFPISNPRRAAVRTGLLISRLPRAPRLDLRVEGAYTDVNDPQSTGGSFLLQEVIYKEAYTNRGFLLGDPLGRENKGGNAWLTFHRSAREDFQFEYRRVKAAKDFVPLGTTQQDITFSARLRPSEHLEVKGSVQQEFTRAPLIDAAQRRPFGATVQLTWFPKVVR
ncbi:capsule assembly Wzi family protein [Terriglobus sp.]|uniref:capsule assembly Wzi family protein n=1 Tax=Terriglobus sp. TaxID=1889013 RepID=UPI003B00DE07